jgi:hypothetical protein
MTEGVGYCGSTEVGNKAFTGSKAMGKSFPHMYFRGACVVPLFRHPLIPKVGRRSSIIGMRAH